MKTVKIKLFLFEELSEEAKQKAIENNYDINVDYEWWDNTYEDAANAGIKINGFDIDRGSYCEGEFIYGAPECSDLIIKNHGEQCNTFKTASTFIGERDNLVFKYSDKINTEIVAEGNEYEFDEDCNELEEKFLKSILEDYLQILRDEYEYRTGEEAIKERLISNEYDFTEDGKMY